MNSPSSESALIAEQLRRAFEGDAWHGPALLELLQDMDAATAAAQPWSDVHSIWELVLHVSAWDNAASLRLGGEKVQLTGTHKFSTGQIPGGRRRGRSPASRQGIDARSAS